MAEQVAFDFGGAAEPDHELIYQVWRCRFCSWTGVYQAKTDWAPTTCWSLSGCRFYLWEDNASTPLELIDEGDERVLAKYSQP